MKKHLESMWLLVALSYCNLLHDDSDILLRKYDPIFLAPSYILCNCSVGHPEPFVSMRNALLANIVHLNAQITGISSVAGRVNFSKNHPEPCSFFIISLTILKKESVLSFLCDLKFYVCVCVDISYPLQSQTPEDKKIKNIILDLFALIYSWWYKQVALAYHFNDEDPTKDNICLRTQEKVKTVFDWLYIIYPSLKQYSIDEEKRIGYENRSKKLLKWLYPKLVRKHIWDQKFLPVILGTVMPNDYRIIKCHKRFSQLWSEYERLSNFIFPHMFSSNSETGFNLFRESFSQFEALLTEFEQIKVELLEQSINDSSNPIITLINDYSTWFENFSTNIDYICSKANQFAKKFRKVADVFSDLFFDSITRSKNDAAVNLTCLIWNERLLLTDTYLLTTAKMIEARDESSRIIANFIITMLNIPNSYYTTHFFFKYNCWFPGLLKTIWDLSLESSNPQLEVEYLSVNVIISYFTSRECGINDLQNLYFAVKHEYLTKQSVHEYTRQLLERITQIYCQNINHLSQRIRTNMITIIYAIHILGYSTFVLWEHFDNLLLTFRKCFIYRLCINNFLHCLQNGNYCKSLLLFMQAQDITLYIFTKNRNFLL